MNVDDATMEPKVYGDPDDTPFGNRSRSPQPRSSTQPALPSPQQHSIATPRPSRQPRRDASRSRDKDPGSSTRDRPSRVNNESQDDSEMLPSGEEDRIPRRDASRSRDDRLPRRRDASRSRDEPRPPTRGRSSRRERSELPRGSRSRDRPEHGRQGRLPRGSRSRDRPAATDIDVDDHDMPNNIGL